MVPVLAWWREPVACGRRTPGRWPRSSGSRWPSLADPAHRFMFRHPSGRTGPAFHIGSMLIWGFTALLVDRLLALGGWERPWDLRDIRALPEGAA